MTHRAIGVLAALVLLTGCGSSGATQEDAVPIADRPSMEQVLGDYVAFRDWDAVRETVRDIGEEHGFTDVRTVTDREDDFEIVGQDQYGGRYVFGTAVNTIFSLSTGCHVWDGEPTYPPPPA